MGQRANSYFVIAFESTQGEEMYLINPSSEDSCFCFEPSYAITFKEYKAAEDYLENYKRMNEMIRNSKCWVQEFFLQ